MGIFNDNFETESVGNLNGQNSWSGSILFQVQTLVKNSGSQAVGCITGGAEVTMQKTGSLVANGTFTFFVRGIAAAQGDLYLNELSQGAGNPLVHINFDVLDNYIRYFNGSSWTNLSTCTANSWYQIDIKWRSSDKKACYQINGGGYSAFDTTQQPFSSGLDTLFLDCSATTLYFDDISSTASAAVYTMVTAPASFTYTPKSSGDKRVMTMVTNKATYVLTGMASGFKRVMTMITNKATYTLTGMSSGFKRVIHLITAPTSYILTGIAAGITAKIKAIYSMITSPATYVMTGQAITIGIRKFYTMITAPAQFILTGMQAGFSSLIQNAVTRLTQFLALRKINNK